MSLSWKTLASKIHPPLPMSSRDSQRLLILLNTSFKQQLDRYHPTSLEQDAGLHLRSILSNPLFESKPSHGARLSVDGRGRSGKALGVLQNLVKRPAEIFKEQVNGGGATLEMAKLCLRAEQRNCFASPNARLGEALGSSGIGSLVLEWLWASGLESSKSFIEDWDFVRHLVPFLVAEKKQYRICRWLQEGNLRGCATVLSGSDVRATKDWSNLLLQLITTENTHGQGLQSATDIFIRSVDESQLTGSRHQQLHTAAAWYLTVAFTDAQKAVQMDRNIIRHFMDAVKTSSRPRSLIIAYQSIHLVEDPYPDVALNYLQGLSTDYRFPKSKSPHVISLGLKAAEILLEKGREHEAMWLMEYLQTNFRDEIGAHASTEHRTPSSRTSPVGDDREMEEEKTLRSLNTLAIS